MPEPTSKLKRGRGHHCDSLALLKPAETEGPTPEEVIELYQSAFITAETALVQAAAAVSMAESISTGSDELAQSTNSSNKQLHSREIFPQNEGTKTSSLPGTGTIEGIYLGSTGS